MTSNRWKALWTALAALALLIAAWVGRYEKVNEWGGLTVYHDRWQGRECLAMGDEDAGELRLECDVDKIREKLDELREAARPKPF